MVNSSIFSFETVKGRKIILEKTKGEQYVNIVLDGVIIGSDAEAAVKERLLSELSKLGNTEKYQNIVNFSDGHCSVYCRPNGEDIQVRIEDSDGNALVEDIVKNAVFFSAVDTLLTAT